MGNAGRNGGEYYTPRPLIRAMIKVVEPQIGETIYDGACGSAGFLCEAWDYLRRDDLSAEEWDTLQRKTFYGQEKKSLAYVLGVMNMILHGIDAPNIRHTNTLAENVMDIQQADRHDIVLANPPFGGGERKEVQQNFPIKSGETAYLFLQHFIRKLQGRRPRRGGDQEHLPQQHRQRQRRAAQGTAGDLQPAHRARLPRRHVPGRGGQDGGAVLRERRARRAKSGITSSIPAAAWARPIRSMTRIWRNSWPCRRARPTATRAGRWRWRMWTTTTWDLSVKNPNAPEAEALRSPEQIIADMLARDEETAADSGRDSGDVVRADWDVKPNR